MSRVGRNYLETGFYTEVVFRKCSVRFIAIANGVDNINPESGEFVPILNVMNEWYLRDQSRKMIAAYRQKGNAGLPTNNNCIYGYKKDPEQKNIGWWTRKPRRWCGVYIKWPVRAMGRMRSPVC